MRAISSFNREAGISTFWCRAWSAFRTLVNMSATGSVNLIVCFSLSHPFAPRRAENLQRLVHHSFVVTRLPLACSPVVANDPTTSDSDALPGRLRNPWNLPAQRQLAEGTGA